MEDYPKGGLEEMAEAIRLLGQAKMGFSPNDPRFSEIDHALMQLQKGYDWYERALKGLIPPDELGLDVE